MLRQTVLPPRTVDAGIFPGQIFTAELVGYSWRQSQANPSGLSVRIGVEINDSRGAAHLFDAIDLSNVGRLASVFASARLTMPDNGIEAAIDTLVGMPVSLTPKIIVPRQGKHAGSPKSVVGQWLPPSTERVVSYPHGER